ncbi:MAG: PF20097 family protein, partial [Lachnospiraceae bacterium]|nr:PF20097 family protein [Lachnospiraceae bacterium]
EVIKIKCPVCNEEMEYGNIKTNEETGVYYLPANVKEKMYTRKEIVKRNGVPLFGPFFTRAHAANIGCWHCRKCKKITISY